MSLRFPDPRLSWLHTGSVFGVPEFPVHHMRGGTSTGIVLWAPLLPAAPELRDELIRHLMGVPLTGRRPGNRQVGGLGRGAPTSNKVFIVEVDAARRRLTSTLAQLAADKSEIDWSVNCGNMSAALPLFALDTGLVGADDDDFELEIHNTNTDSRMTARMRLADGGRSLRADTRIPGVDGDYPGVDLYLHEPVGAKTGALLPTGQACDEIDGIAVSCVDVAVPMLIVAAASLGKTGRETPAELDADAAFKERLRALWVAAGLKMGLKLRSGEPMSAAQLAASETVPKVCLVAPPAEDGHLLARYFTPQAAHASLAVSGGCCLASACLIPGSVAQRLARGVPAVGPDAATFDIALENPAGLLATRIQAVQRDGRVQIRQAAYRRSAQLLLRGNFPLYRASPGLRAALAPPDDRN